MTMMKHNKGAHIHQWKGHPLYMFVIHSISCHLQLISILSYQPPVLPYSHLFDVDACAKFVSDFVYYNPDR